MTKTPAFQIHFRVYYEDTDAGGIVYYANYLKFAERARTELLRSLGFEQQKLRKEQHIGFVVRRLEVDYRRPARLDDTLLIETRVHALKPASLRMVQWVMCGEQVLVRLDVHLACLRQDGRPVRVPDDLSKALQKVAVPEAAVAPGTFSPSTVSKKEGLSERLQKARKLSLLNVPPKSKQH